MTRLNLFLLGAPRVELDGKPIDLSRRKVLALLIYLAVTRQPQRRDTLATLFWPESGQEAARSSLRRELFTLTSALGEGWLVSDRESVTLTDNAPIWLDVEAFRQHLTACRSHGHAPDNVCAACLDPLTAAVTLYQGDFLAGFTLSDSPQFDDWQFFHADALRRELADALEKLVRLHRERGEYDTGITYARRWLLIDSLHEPVHRLLMQLYAWAGQQTAALRQYQECVRLLDEELGVEPEPETTAIFETIRTRRLSEPNADKVTVPVSNPVTPSPLHPVTPSPLHNLPPQPTPFIGRQQEVAQIVERLADPACRLLTLVGPGGMGKTRLALKAAEQLSTSPTLRQRFVDGAVFVQLAPLATAQHVPTTIADALRISLEQASDVQQRLLEVLQKRHLLLVLDNFEHLLVSSETGPASALALLQQILDNAPQVSLLVTSRERLRLAHEQIFELTGLTTPNQASPTPDTIAQAEAVMLFVERAQRATRHFALTADNFQAVARICRILNGMPLALELAAAWSRTLACDEIADEIQRNIAFLAVTDRTMEARHRSMRAVFDHSWALLNPSEQQSLAQLAVFAGGCRREAAQAVAGASLPRLAALIDKSLVEKQQNGPNTRYTMHELVRQYCLVQLQQSGQEAQTRRRHLLHYVELAEQARPNLRRAEQVQWLARLGEEHDNLRAALRWALDNGEAEAAARITWSIWTFWWLRNYISEGRYWSDQVLVHKAQLSLFRLIRATVAMVAMAYGQGDLVTCDQIIVELRELSRQAGRDALAEAFADAGVGLVATLRGDKATALHYLPLSIPLLEEAEEEGLASQMITLIGTVHLLDDDYEQALPYFEAGLAHSQRVGDRQGITTAFFNLAQIALARNELAVAKQRFTEGLPYVQALADRSHIANLLEGLAAVAGSEGDHAQAAQLFGAAEGLFERAGVRGQIFHQPYQSRYAALRAAAEQALGSAQYATLWRAGWTMALGSDEGFAPLLAPRPLPEPEGQTRRQGDKVTGRQEPVLSTTKDDKVNEEHPLTLSPPHLVTSFPPHNLPPQTTPFVGRQQEVAQIVERLADPACRLLTLVGPGGMGKTRLALQAAQTILEAFNTPDRANHPPSTIHHRSTEAHERPPFTDGLFFVPLDTVQTPSGICAAIADALDLPLSGNVSPQQQVVEYLRPRRQLFVLDNFEQLLTPMLQAESDAVITALLAAAPGVKLLVTSRQALNLRDEWFHQIGGLAFPDSATAFVAAPQRYDAVHLFAQCARRARRNFTLETELAQVLRVCRLVERMPLALELAASWLKVLPVAEVADQIGRSLDILVTRNQDVPPRQRSMRVVLDESWQRLTGDEQAILARLAVFQEGFQQEAATAVAGASLAHLATFTEKALLRVVEIGRYQMHELLRQYAALRLAEEAEALAATQVRHCEYYLTLLQRTQASMQDQRQKEAIAELKGELDNLRAAWAYALQHQQVQLLSETTFALYYFYDIHNNKHEGEALFRHAAEQVEYWMRVRVADASPTVQRQLQALLGDLRARQAFFLFRQGQSEQTIAIYDACLALLRPLGPAKALNHALLFYGSFQWGLGNFVQARNLLEEGLQNSVQIHDVWQHLLYLSILGALTHDQGDYVEAHRLLSEAVASAQRLGDTHQICYTIGNLGRTMHILGRMAELKPLIENALRLAQQAEDSFSVAFIYEQQAVLTHANGAHEEALQQLDNPIERYRAIYDAWSLSRALTLRGDFLLEVGKATDAHTSFAEASRTAHNAQLAPFWSEAQAGLAQCAAALGETDKARSLAEQLLAHPGATQEAKRRATAIMA